MRLLDAVRAFLAEHGIENCRITVALSGGADSVSLLHALYSLKTDFSLDLCAIHIQHNLRGMESERDEQFCRELCRSLDIPLQVASCDVMGYAQEHGMSIETAARECRYDAFSRYCDGFVATAHTASDNLETVLLRLTRGTGLKGLCAIPPQRSQFLRPLLRVSRTQVEEFAAENGLSYVTDSTNAQDCYRRNFLRHNVVPALRECNPSLEESFARMVQALHADEDFLAIQAKSAFDACRRTDGALEGLDALHPAMQRRCIGMLLAEYGVSNHHNILVVQSLLQSGGSAELSRGKLRAHVSRKILWMEEVYVETPEKILKIGENSIFKGIVVEAAIIPRTNLEKFESVHRMFTNNVLDYDIINKCAVLHGRRPGLRIKTQNRAHHISVKKWLSESVSPPERARVHFLSDESGLLWVQGLGAAEHAAVTERTQNLLYLRIITE